MILKPKARIFTIFVIVSIFLILSDFSCTQKYTIDSIHWKKGSFEDLLKLAESKKKNIMIYIFSDWCKPCVKIKDNVLPDKEVVEFINRDFIAYWGDTKDSEVGEIMKNYHIAQYPTFLFLKPDGIELERSVGNREKDSLMTLFKNIKDNKTVLGENLALIKKEPNNAPALLEIMKVYASRSDAKNVELYMNEIKKADPVFYDTNLDDIGSVSTNTYFAVGEYQKAVDITLEVLKAGKDQNKRAKYLFIAAAYTNMGEYAKAFEMHNKALAEAPNEIYMYTNIVNFCLTNNVELDKGIAVGLKGLAMEGQKEQKADLYYNMGRLYQKKNNMKKAEEMVDKAIALNPLEAYKNQKDLISGSTIITGSSLVIFTPKEWDFGHIKKGAKPELKLLVENKSTVTSELDIKGSCTCNTAIPANLKLASGIKSEVTLTYDSTNDAGKVEKYFIIKTNMKGMEKVLYPVIGTVE